MPIDLLILFLAIFCGMFIQTVLGFAAGLCMLPILVTQYSIVDSVALISIFNLSFSCIQVKAVWTDIRKETFKELLPGTLLGTAAGVFLLLYTQPILLKRILGIFIVTYVGYSFLKQRKVDAFLKLGTFFGFLGGFFAGLFSSGSPPFVAYLHNRYDDPKVLRANIIAILSVTNLIRPLLLIAQGIYTWNLCIQGLLAFPVFALTLYCGEKARAYVPKTIFKRLVLVFLALAGIALLLR